MNAATKRWVLIGVVAWAGVAALNVARAQGFVDEPTCYSWEGGHKSAGSFHKCGPRWVIAERKAPVVLAPLAAAPTPNPVMVPMQSCPPIATPQKRKPIVKRKPKPVIC